MRMDFFDETIDFFFKGINLCYKSFIQSKQTVQFNIKDGIVYT